MVYTLSNQWLLVGITSNGIGCARANYMGAYTRLAAFETWIRSYTNDSITPRSSTPSDIHPPDSAQSIPIFSSLNYAFFLALPLLLVK